MRKSRVVPYLTLLYISLAGSVAAQELSDSQRRSQADALLRQGIAAFEAKNYEEAANSYEESLEYWVIDLAAANLCNLYLYGVGVQRDFGKARALCETAAQFDHPNALTMLGEMYQLGNGVAANRETAIEYYRRAAELGHVHAEYSLGFILFETDPNEGIWWLTKAADRDYEPAKRALDYVERLAAPTGDPNR